MYRSLSIKLREVGIAMKELMERIAQLEVFKEQIQNGKFDPEVMPAAIDWIDNAIAEHTADLEAMVAKQAA